MIPLKQSFAEDQGPQIGQFEAAYELATMDTFMGGWARDTALEDMNGPSAKKLDPEELNSKYTDVEVPFNKPMSEVAAFHLNEEGKKRRQLAEIIQNGPKGSFYGQVANLGAGLIAHATDPVEFGVGAFTGMGIRGLGVLAKSGTFGSYSAITKSGEILAKGGFRTEAAEGILGNLALEPIMYNQSKRAQVDYGIEDAFISVVGGGLAAPVLKKGLSKLINLPDSTVGMALKNSVGQVQEGFRPTPELHVKGYRDIALRNPPEGAQLGEIRSSYKFEPVAPEAMKDKPFFMTGDSLESPKNIDDMFEITDNPNFANNVAAHPMDDSIHDVFEVKLNEMKLADYETIRERLIEADGDELKVQAVMDELKGQGYEGVVKTDSSVGHNAVHVFPESRAKIQEASRFRSDPNSVPSLDASEVEKIRAAARSRENEIGFDADVHGEFEKFMLPDDLKVADSSKLDAELDETLKTFAGMEKEGMLSSASKEALEKVKASKQARQSIPEVISDYFNCLTSGGAA